MAEAFNLDMQSILWVGHVAVSQIQAERIGSPHGGVFWDHWKTCHLPRRKTPKQTFEHLK